MGNQRKEKGGKKNKRGITKRVVKKKTSEKKVPEGDQRGGG